MAEMVCSALVQEAVSRAVSSVLGKREEKASQEHIRERLELAANEMELVLERSAKLPITDVSLLDRRKTIKCAYLKAAQLLDKHKKHAVLESQEQIDQGVVKRKRWIISAKFLSTSSFSGLNTEDVRRVEWYAECARKFLSDLYSGCPLSHTFCNPLVRHLLEGKTIFYRSTEQGNRGRCFGIWPVYSEERGTEALLLYGYKDDIVVEKSFDMALNMRLSESTDIAWVAIKCLQFLTSQLKIAAESAMGELTRLQDNSRPSSVIPRLNNSIIIRDNQKHRPDPACCRASRIEHYADSSFSSEVSHTFLENIICFTFRSSVSTLLECSSHRSSDEADTLELTVTVSPHYTDINFALCQLIEIFLKDVWVVKKIFPDDRYLIGGTIPQVAEVFFSREISHFVDNPESTGFRRWGRRCWLSSKHGGALFEVKKPSTKISAAPQTRRRYNTRASTKRIRR